MTTLHSDKAMGTVKEKHRLLINPQPNKLVLLLKYPTRQPDELYCDAFGNKPLELRIKPKCGLVEVDVPIDVHHHFDREKGIEFGAALRKKALTGDSNSFYGISGGLHPGSSRKGDDVSPALEGPPLDKMLDAFDDANRDGYVMNKITLGGRIEPFKDGDPIYMLATFEGGTSTWTPLNGIVMLRPQFEHLDALRLHQAPGSRSTRHEDDDSKKESKAEDVNMTVKDTEEDEAQDDLYGGMAETLKTLRAMAEEPWQRLQWIDSGDGRAYGMWNSTLVYQRPEQAPILTSNMTQEQYLNAISCPRIDPIHKGRNIMRPLNADPDDFGLTTDDDEDDDNVNEEEEKTQSQVPPPRITKHPDPKTKYLIELTCRTFSQFLPPQLAQFITFSKPTLQQSKEDYAFLKQTHPFHRFFLWRLKRNRAKRGWNLQKLRQQLSKELDKADLEHSQPAGQSPSVELANRSQGDENENPSTVINISPDDAPVAETPSPRRSNRSGAKGKKKGQKT